MAKEMMIVFVYDRECCQDEADDPVSAVLYFHPSWVSDVQKLSLCGQLMGTTHFLHETFGKPRIISLQSGKFVLKEFGRFILAVGTDRNLTNSILEHRANLLTSFVRFFHRDIQTMYDQFTSTGQYKNLSDKLYHIFETYLPILQYNGNIFQNMPMCRLPKSASNIFLEAMQTLQSCQQTKGVLGGCVLYHNKVVATQLPPELTKNIVLTDPYRIKSTGESISVDFHIPVGVQLIVVYIRLSDYRKLIADAQRAQMVNNQNANPIVPFQFKKKMKRDKSIIFTNIPEEGIPDVEPPDENATASKSTTIKPRPNHLPLRFKTISSKEIPESGFNSINFDESDSYPHFIGKTSVCSTPMTENKILHDNFMSICVNPTDEAANQKSAENKIDNKQEFQKVLSNATLNPLKLETRRNSLTDLSDTLKRFSQRITMRPFGFGIGLSKLPKAADNPFDADDDVEIDDFDKKIYRTITDPTYPVFNSNGEPISKSLFQELISGKQDEQNGAENYEDHILEDDAIIEGFDSDMKESPIKQLSTVKNDDASEITKPNPSNAINNRKTLSLPLKSLTHDSDTISLNQKLESTNENIFETPAQRKKLSGIQLTPLMSKLSVLAMTDERSSGFSSWDTTPGVELMTPVDGNKLLRRRSSTKFDDIIDADRNGDGMQKLELFICGQQNMTLFLLLEETAAQKHELIQSMFDICVARLTRIENSLNQSLSVNVDGDKNEGGYSFISLDQHWDTLQRGGPWSLPDLTSIEFMRSNFQHNSTMTDMILKTEESVLYGYHIGQSGIFYKQAAIMQNGLPAPADVMGTIPLSARRRLERDHSIILL